MTKQLLENVYADLRTGDDYDVPVSEIWDRVATAMRMFGWSDVPDSLGAMDDRIAKGERGTWAAAYDRVWKGTAELIVREMMDASKHRD